MDEDTPETIYECPVCQECLPLKLMAKHLGNHIRKDKDRITPENADFIRGLLHVVDQVVDKPRRNRGRRETPITFRTRYFTHYWANSTWRYEAARLDLLSHTAGNQFRKKNIRHGDEIYIITVSDGQIMLGGKIIVDQIVSKTEAARILGVEPDEIWEAREHVIADDEHIYTFDPCNEVPLDIAKAIRIKTSDGTRGLKTAGDGDEIDPQTVRGVCELTSNSAELLDLLL